MHKHTMHKRTGIVIIAIAVIVIASAIAIHAKRLVLRSPVLFLDQPQQVVSQDPEVSTQKTSSLSAFGTISTADGIATQHLPYRAALARFGENRIILDVDCHVLPTQLVIGLSDVVMLDNQSNQQHSVAVGPRVYSIAPRDYAIANFSIPTDYLVGCDEKQNVAVISVKK